MAPMYRKCPVSWRWLAAVEIAVIAALSACSGSSSETPWPVEPPDRDPAPAGEELKKGNVLDVNKLPDNYSKRDAGADAEPGD